MGSDIEANEVRSRAAEGCICLPFKHGGRHIGNAKLRERRILVTHSRVGTKCRRDWELTRPQKGKSQHIVAGATMQIVPTTVFISYEDGRNRRHDRLNDNYDRPNQ